MDVVGVDEWANPWAREYRYGALVGLSGRERGQCGGDGWMNE